MASTRRRGDDLWWYAGAVAAGSVLIVVAAISQPYNQNEIKQIEPYGSNDFSTITQGTRQPPLDPLLGSLVQHLLGEGQLRQRLVPVLAGIGVLVVLGLLFRRLGLGYAGAFGVLFVALQPVMVHYSGYARPYALPLFFAVLFVYAAHRWMEELRTSWLFAAVGAACALPLTRVPEPNIFLLAAAATLTWLLLRGRRTWSQAGPLVALALAAVAFIGYPLSRSLASSTAPQFDPSPSTVAARFPGGAREVLTHVVPWMGDWFPWWPLTAVIVVSAFVVGSSRRRLLGEWGWAFWPLLVAPLGFLLAYHFLIPPSFAARPYRDRYAYFFLPAFGMLIAALAAAVEDPRGVGRRARLALAAVLGVGLLAQLPATAKVLTVDVSPDYAQAGQVLVRELPADASVLYATPLPMPKYRLPFEKLQVPTYQMPTILDPRFLAQRPRGAPTRGPVYVLVLAGECANTSYCDAPAPVWDHQVRGWEALSTFDRFTLYAAEDPKSGRRALIDALVSFADAFGPELGMLETYAAAALLDAGGHSRAAHELISEALRSLDPVTRKTYRDYANSHGYNPFEPESEPAVG